MNRLTFDLAQVYTIARQGQVDDVAGDCSSSRRYGCTSERQAKAFVEVGSGLRHVFGQEDQNIRDEVAGIQHNDSPFESRGNGRDRAGSRGRNSMFAREVAGSVLEPVTARVSGGYTDGSQSGQNIVVDVRKGCRVVGRVVNNAANGDAGGCTRTSGRSRAAVINRVQDVQSQRTVLGLDEADSRVGSQTF